MFRALSIVCHRIIESDVAFSRDEDSPKDLIMRSCIFPIEEHDMTPEERQEYADKRRQLEVARKPHTAKEDGKY